ncbi:C-C motif chemokine 20 isoform X1 [Prionailurus iriomotensis]
MMDSGKNLLLAALMSVLLLHLCSKSEAASSFDCCLRYTERIVHPRFIVGFTQQLSNEACDINAIMLLHKEKIRCVRRSKEELGETGCAYPQPKSQEDVKTDALCEGIGQNPRTKESSWSWQLRV